MAAQITDLITRAERFADGNGLSLSTVSRKLLNDGKGIARLKNGGQCTLKTIETAFERLAALETGTPAQNTRPASANNTIASAGASNPGHLDRLEAESIHIMREVAAEAENPVMLYSVGKDSAVMLHLALKAFYPSKPPFPLLHVDTTWKFREMIAFRDNLVQELGLDLRVHINEDGVRQGVGPFTHGSALHTDIMKT
ncbi:MAG: phosphoadenosine phosphosulfate reductase family protein, partial [Pseudomonadota bacterium]